MIQNILFDFGGVIFRLNSIEEPIRRFQKLGFTNVRDFLGLYGQRDLFLDVELGRIDEGEFLRRLAILCDKQFIHYDEAKWAWIGFVRDVPPTGLENLLKLKNNYRIGLLSNTNGFIQNWARSDDFSGDGHSIYHYFDELFCSHELHEYKPAPEMFKKTLELGHFYPEETLFLDDSPKNIQGARDVGLHAILVPSDCANWMPAIEDYMKSIGESLKI